MSHTCQLIGHDWSGWELRSTYSSRMYKHKSYGSGYTEWRLCRRCEEHQIYDSGAGAFNKEFPDCPIYSVTEEERGK